MFTDPDPVAPPKSRKNCPTCDATPSGCRSLHWLAGRYCCEACTGDHDTTTERNDR